jgi:hypothetical protein
MPDQPFDPRDVEQTRRYIRQLVQEINHLSGSDIPPQQFYGEFLQRVVAAVAAVGGAVWSRDGQQPPRLQHHVNFASSGLLDEAAGAGGHVPLLMSAFSNGSAKLIPPHSGAGGDAEGDAGANQSDWSLLISPMQVDKQTVGVVELLMDPSRRPTALENAVRFVQELCDIGAGYLKNRQLKQMLSQQHLWSQLESFVREIHGSLTPKEVAYIVANEGKRMIGCDRLSVAIVYGRKAVVDGVSGQEVIERKSTLVQLLTHLCNTALQSGEGLLYTGEQRDDLPPAVRDTLDDYVAESGSKILGITLLRTIDKEGAPEKPFGVLVAEQLADASAPGTLIPRMEVVGQHGAIALSNALSHHRVFMLPVWKFVGNWTNVMRGNRLAKAGIALAGVAVITAAMLLVPMELRMHGKGKFTAEIRRAVYAEEDGIVIEVPVDHGEVITAGQLLVQMRSEPLLLEYDSRLAELNKAEQASNAALEKMRAEQNGTAPSGSAGADYRIAQNELESQEKARKLVEKRLDSLSVRAPIEGMIATWEPFRTLHRRPVKRGEELLVVSQVDGKDENGKDARWILEVKMPEHKMGHVLEAESDRIARGDQAPLRASFILASHPQTRFNAHVERIATMAEFDQDLKEHIVMVRIVPEDVVGFQTEVIPAENGKGRRIRTVTMKMTDGTELKLSPDAEVQAKIDCGRCTLGYWALGELIEWFYETVLF